MHTSKAVDAVRSAVTALNEGKIDGYLEQFDPSSKRWLVGAATPLSLTDISDNLHQMQAAFAGLHLEEELLFGDERFVCARWRLRGRHVGDYLGFAPTGHSMEVEGVDLWTMRDGRIARYRAFYDMNDVARQLAIAPAPGSRAEKAVVALQRLQARMLRRRGG